MWAWETFHLVRCDDIWRINHERKILENKYLKILSKYRWPERPQMVKRALVSSGLERSHANPTWIVGIDILWCFETYLKKAAAGGCHVTKGFSCERLVVSVLWDLWSLCVTKPFINSLLYSSLDYTSVPIAWNPCLWSRIEVIQPESRNLLVWSISSLIKII